jgi:predicted enzyme related to lactoylglutathione lyase
MHGQFVWYELTTPDVDAAIRFYPRFTGWGQQQFDETYTMWTDGAVPVGGIFRLTDEMRAQGVPPNWMPYVEVSNVDDTATKASSLGGTVVAGPNDIPGIGRYAVVQDPQGATFGIYKSTAVSGAWDGKAVVGRFSWHELMTSDYAKAFEFYQALFGWQKMGEMDMGGGAMYQLFGKGDAQFGGMFDRPVEMSGMHPFWLVYIHVKDVAKAVGIATKAGAFVQRPQMEIPGGTIAILGDPQGAGFALHDTATMASASATVVKAGQALKSAVNTAVKAVTKAVKKVRKAAPKKKTMAKAKAKTKARSTAARKVKPKAKAKTKASARRTKAKSRTTRKPVKRKTSRKSSPKKTRRTGRAKSKK